VWRRAGGGLLLSLLSLLLLGLLLLDLWLLRAWTAVHLRATLLLGTVLWALSLVVVSRAGGVASITVHTRGHWSLRASLLRPSLSRALLRAILRSSTRARGIASIWSIVHWRTTVLHLLLLLLVRRIQRRGITVRARGRRVAALVVLEGAGDGFTRVCAAGAGAGGDGGVGDAGSWEDALGGAVFFDAHALAGC
jgi:hypothetical protein